jgi:hypothetical protein
MLSFKLFRGPLNKISKLFRISVKMKGEKMIANNTFHKSFVLFVVVQEMVPQWLLEKTKSH